MYIYSTSNGEIHTINNSEVRAIHQYAIPDEDGCTWRIFRKSKLPDDWINCKEVVKIEILGRVNYLKLGPLCPDPLYKYWNESDCQKAIEDLGKTFQDGEEVTFRSKRYVDMGINPEKIKSHEGARAKILRLVGYNKLGSKDHEYYDIKFEDGFELLYVCGYHLNPIN